MGARFRWPRFRKLERHELGWLIAGLSVCLLLWGFLALASEVVEGDTTTLDTKILLSLRKADDPSRPIGPAWVETAMLDLTAIGGPTVLWLVVLSVVGFLALQGRYHSALVVLITAASGEVANVAMKNLLTPPAADSRPAPSRCRIDELPKRTRHGVRDHLPDARRDADAAG